jgi:hypothetical protein
MTRWHQPSRSATCKNGNVAFAYFLFLSNLFTNKCKTQCKWKEFKLRDRCKYNNIVEWSTNKVSTIDRVDSKIDFSKTAKIFVLILSKGDFLRRKLSWKRNCQSKYVRKSSHIVGHWWADILQQLAVPHYSLRKLGKNDKFMVFAMLVGVC